MGKNDAIAAKHPLVLLKLEHFKSIDDSRPPVSSVLATCVVLVAFLIGTEMLMRIFFFHVKVGTVTRTGTGAVVEHNTVTMLLYTGCVCCCCCCCCCCVLCVC